MGILELRNTFSELANASETLKSRMDQAKENQWGQRLAIGKYTLKGGKNEKEQRTL